MAEENQKNTKSINKVKIYLIAIGIFLLVNFAFEVGVTLLENGTGQWLYPIFPFSRVGLLVLTVLVASWYIRKREHKPKQKLWWRILRPILFILLAYGLTMGAWLSVSQTDADRAAAEAEETRESAPTLEIPEPPQLDTTYETN